MGSLLEASEPKDTYILETGEAGAKRLALQNELMFKQSTDHLKDAGLTSGQVIYDVGCGSGEMTIYMARVVGPSGHVFAIDQSEAQLEIVKRKLKEEGLENITCIQADMTSAHIPCQKPADLVFARFLLMHVKTPQTAIKNMENLLKPNGLLVLEEPESSSSRSEDGSNDLAELVRAKMAMGKRRGVDFDIGSKLKGIVEEMGLQDISQKEYQHLLDAATAQSMLELSFNEWGRKAVDEKSISQAEFEKLLEQIKALNKPYYSARMYYVIARKPQRGKKKHHYIASQ